jgi:hypothetical protein
MVQILSEFVTFAVLLIAAVFGFFGLPTQLHYKIGEDIDFQCSSVVDTRGLLQDGTRTSGSYSVLTGIVVTKTSPLLEFSVAFQRRQCFPIDVAVAIQR